MLMALIIVMAVSLGFNIKTAIKNYGDRKLQEGFQQGQNQINNLMIQQLLLNGKIGINVPLNAEGQFDPAGEVKMIILVPQTQ